MTDRPIARGLLAALLIALSPVAICAEPRGHAHNDYEHARPLLDALEHGFSSIEADIWLRDGALLIGHDESDLTPERTLESLYLEPLAAMAAAHDPLLAADPEPLQLLVDIKTDGGATFAALSDLLGQYAAMLTRIEDGKRIAGGVTIVISGNRPLDAIKSESPRLAFYDGRLSDLEGGLPPDLMPLVSDNWTRHFSWDGRGEMPANESERLAAIVARAHDAGYALRFWATPDGPGESRDALWEALAAAGVDYLNTDDLAGFADFLATR